MRECLDVLLPRVIPGVSFETRVFRGKADLLKKLPNRLLGYAHWPIRPLIVVIVDRDEDDCLELKQQMNQAADKAGLEVASPSAKTRGTVLNRVAVEELEAWFFGDVPAMVRAYGISSSLGQRARYRHPDAIRGGTWEALERELRGHGHPGGLEKTRAAREIAPHMNIDQNNSPSFCSFRDGLRFMVEDV